MNNKIENVWEEELGAEGFDPLDVIDREKYEELFHLRGKRRIFSTVDGRDVRVGDWLYLDQPEGKHRSEKAPDIIEGFYKSYYKQVFVVVRVGLIGKELGVRKTFKLEDFKRKVHIGEIVLLDMPKYQYGDRFKNKYNKEELIIRDVPRSKNDKEDEFCYYVRTYSLKTGYNYRTMFESEIKEFYHTEGTIKR